MDPTDTLLYGLQLLEAIPVVPKVYYVGFHQKPRNDCTTIEQLRAAFPNDQVETHGDFFEVSKLYSPKEVTLSNGLTKPTQTLNINELRERFRNCTVVVTHKGVRVRRLRSNCQMCAKGMQPHERRDGICSTCHNKQVIDCKFCHRKVQREHRCVRMPQEIRKDNKIYKLCNHCNKYISKNSHKRHVQRKHVSYNFQCKKCPKKFGCKSDLNMHMTMHSAVRRFECKHCGETFKWQSHRSKHTKDKHPDTERPQKPDVCLDTEINLLTQSQMQGRGELGGLQDILRTLGVPV